MGCPILPPGAIPPDDGTVAATFGSPRLSRGSNMDVDQHGTDTGLGEISLITSSTIADPPLSPLSLSNATVGENVPAIQNPNADQPTRNLHSTEHGAFDPVPAIDPILDQTTGLSSSIACGTVACRRGRSEDLPHKTTPTLGPTIRPTVWPPPGISQGNIAAARHSNGLSHHLSPEHAFTASTIQQTFGLITGLPSGMVYTNAGVATRGGGSVYSEDNPLSLGTPPFGLNAEHPGSSVPSQQSSDPNEQNFHASQMGTNRGFPRRTPTLLPPATASRAEVPLAPQQSDPSYTDEPPFSPTTPTRQHNSRPSGKPRQEVPRMLGEMRDVMENLAVSINGLKDVVSDLRTRQDAPGGSGSSRRWRGSRGRRGGNRNRGGVRGGTRGGGNRSRRTGGPVGDEYVADDEDQEDEDVEDQKNYKLRVSVAAYVLRIWD